MDMRQHLRIEIENTTSGKWAWRVIAVSANNEPWVHAQGEAVDFAAAAAAAHKAGLVS